MECQTRATIREHMGDFLVCCQHPRLQPDCKQVVADIGWPSIGGTAKTSREILTLDDQILIGRQGGASFLATEALSALILCHFPKVEDTESQRLVQVDLIRRCQNNHLSDGQLPTGKFAIVLWDQRTRELTACTDPMRTVPLYYTETRQGISLATDIRLLLPLLPKVPEPEPIAIYHHLNFSYVPTPYTIFRGIRKLPPGTRLVANQNGVSLSRYWMPRYPEDLKCNEEDLANLLRKEIVASVERSRPASATWGTFLSGGTDSSSITGILAREAGPGKVKSFSIGFAEPGFDELEYAHIAAGQYYTNSFSTKVSATDTLRAIDTLVSAYDEPFGNSSAIPTFYCAELARRNGVDTLIAGDGGDEIFGGNERYTKDYFFSLYYRQPAPLQALFRGLGTVMDLMGNRLSNRIDNFIRRASLPNPERFYSDDSFASDVFDQLLTPDFQKTVQVNDSLDLVRKLYEEADSRSELHRLFYVDLQMAIADNDLTKVNRAAKAAGISVLYPYLDQALIDLTGRIPVRYKVNNGKKRYLFKKALADLLPSAILKKKKHGFGLPVGIWFRTHPQFKALLNDILFSQRSKERGYFNMNYVDRLLERHNKGLWDYSNELWLLLMLELWHRKYVDL